MMVSDSWAIRPAKESDWRAMRMLLPRAFHHGARPGAVVATGDGGRVIVGVAAISPRLRSGPMIGPRVDVHVVEPYRRRGIGRRLLATAAGIAARQGAGGLYAWQPIPAGSDDVQLYRRMGMDRSLAIQQGSASVQKSYAYLRPFYDQIVMRKWIPRNARLAPLHPDHGQEIARLHVQHLGGQFADVLRTIRGETPLVYHPRLSPVLLVDDRVMGFTLTQVFQPGVAVVEGTAVDPALRRGWANLWIKFAGACACLEEGIHTLVYYTYERHTDTRKLARQVGVTVMEMVEPYMKLGNSPSADAPTPDAPADRIPARP